MKNKPFQFQIETFIQTQISRRKKKVHTKMLSHLEHQPAVTVGHLQGIENGRQALIELNIHHSSDHSHDASVGQGSLGRWGSVTPA